MFQYRTERYNGYSVKYSPFFDSRLAVAASANFGLVGNGRLYILELTPDGVLPVKWYDTQDSLFDTAWSEAHENQILGASGDGSIKLFDIALDAFPIQSWSEHSREVFCVHWNIVSKNTFLSSSWDGTVKIWDPFNQSSLTTLPTHSCTYSAEFSPHSASVLSAVSSDSHLRIFDLRTPSSAQNHLTIAIPIHAPSSQSGLPLAGFAPSEALSLGWNKYRETVLATGSVDRLIRIFDLRAPKQPVAVLQGHNYAVRRLTWSPHLSDVLLSASYDMTCKVWKDGSTQANGTNEASAVPLIGRELGSMGRHTEFATGIDWCLFGAEGWCASCGWDEMVMIWDAKAIMRS